MKKPAGPKFILDIILVVAFLFLMDEWSLLGIRFHEIAGLAIFLLFILHKSLNWGFIKSTASGLFGRAPVRNRVCLILDVLMLVGFVLITLSGMAIAKTIDFSWLGMSRGRTPVWRFLHTASALTVLLVVGAHIGLHWTWIRARLPKIEMKPALRRAAAVMATTAIIAGAIYFQGKVRFVERTGASYGIVISGGKNMPARPPRGPQSAAPSEKKPGFPGNPGESSPITQGRNGRGEGPGAARSMVSLQKVVPYALILALMALVSRLADILISRAAGSGRSSC